MEKPPFAPPARGPSEGRACESGTARGFGGRRAPPAELSAQNSTLRAISGVLAGASSVIAVAGFGIGLPAVAYGIWLGNDAQAITMGDADLYFWALELLGAGRPAREEGPARVPVAGRDRLAGIAARGRPERAGGPSARAGGADVRAGRARGRAERAGGPPADMAQMSQFSSW